MILQIWKNCELGALKTWKFGFLGFWPMKMSYYRNLSNNNSLKIETVPNRFGTWLICGAYQPIKFQYFVGHPVGTTCFWFGVVVCARWLPGWSCARGVLLLCDACFVLTSICLPVLLFFLFLLLCCFLFLFLFLVLFLVLVLFLFFVFWFVFVCLSVIHLFFLFCLFVFYFACLFFVRVCCFVSHGWITFPLRTARVLDT